MCIYIYTNIYKYIIYNEGRFKTIWFQCSFWAENNLSILKKCFKYTKYIDYLRVIRRCNWSLKTKIAEKGNVAHLRNQCKNYANLPVIRMFARYANLPTSQEPISYTNHPIVWHSCAFIQGIKSLHIPSSQRSKFLSKQSKIPEGQGLIIRFHIKLWGGSPFGD